MTGATMRPKDDGQLHAQDLDLVAMQIAGLHKALQKVQFSSVVSDRLTG